MRNEMFYSTVAQVIPALLIAVAVELIGVRRDAFDAGHRPDPAELERQYASPDPPIDVLVILSALTGIVAFIAEACAVLVILTGTETWFPLAAGPFCTVAVLVMTLFVAWISWVQLIQMNAGRLG